MCLDEWENSVKMRAEYENDKTAQNKMLLPLETRQGITITGILLFLAQYFHLLFILFQ